MEQIGVYLYGFIPAGTAIDLGEIAGVEGAGTVQVVDLKGALAVIGEVSVDAFEAALADGPDPSWLIPRALGHERVLGAVLTRSAVLPVRFGSIFSSRSALERLVSTHLDVIKPYFETIGDCREWSLRGYVDAESSAARVLEFAPELAARLARLPEAPGARYFQEKKLREDARIAARTMGAAEASAVRRAIREAVSEVQTLPLRASESAGRDMVLHEAILIPRGHEAAVLTAVQNSSAASGGLLIFEPSGPWPPFHFCPELAEAPQ